MLPFAFGKMKLKNAVNQRCRQRLWGQLVWSVHRGPAGRWAKKRSGSFFKGEILIKNSVSKIPKELHSRGKWRTHLWKSIQLHYCPQWRWMDKIYKKNLGGSGWSPEKQVLSLLLHSNIWTTLDELCSFTVSNFSLHVKCLHNIKLHHQFYHPRF